MGIILIMPLPKTLAGITVASATRAKGQLVAQFWMALPERTSPMAIIIGPVTSGGKKRMILSMPNDLMSAAIRK